MPTHVSLEFGAFTRTTRAAAGFARMKPIRIASHV